MLEQRKATSDMTFRDTLWTHSKRVPTGIVEDVVYQDDEGFPYTEEVEVRRLDRHWGTWQSCCKPGCDGSYKNRPTFRGLILQALAAGGLMIVLIFVVKLFTLLF